MVMGIDLVGVLVGELVHDLVDGLVDGSGSGGAIAVGPWPAPDVSNAAFVAPTAMVMGRVSVGTEVSIWYGAVVRGDVSEIGLGDRVNIQDGAVLHGDAGEPTILEADVTVGHRAVIHSAHIERGCIVGMGAIVLNGVRVGAGSVIGAGAVVTKDVPPRSLVLGVPGKVVRELPETALEEAIAHAAKYVQLARCHGGTGTDPGFG
ncbi:MAG: gamma carbonic anhydrase family protein [Cyanophyceae cyanobacterium]